MEAKILAYRDLTVGERLAKLNREALIDSFRGVQRGMTTSSEYADHTVDELQEFLRERDLPVSGTKAELIQRLEDEDAAEAGATAEPQDQPSDEARDAGSGEPADLDMNVEDPDSLRDADPAANRPLVEEPEDTTCKGSGLEVNPPVPEEQRHPFPCPFCGKNFDLDVLDPEAPPEPDVIPDHDDIRLVPEEPAEPDTPPETPPHQVQGREEDFGLAPQDEGAAG